MYAKTAQPVEIPKEGGSVRYYPNGYVYWITTSSWDPEKRRTIDDRTCIGKKVADKPGWLYPNKRFFELFGSVAESQKGKTTVSQRGYFSVILNYGVYYALNRTAEKCGLTNALQSVFSADDCTKIFALAMHAIDAQNSIAQDFPDWCFNNYCGIKRPLHNSEISTFYQELAAAKGCFDSFMRNFRQNYCKAFPNEARGALAFDSTNQNTASKNLALAEFGHAKINEQLPDINTAMFVDEKTGIPLYYEHFCGSLLDKSETPVTLKKAGDLGFEHLFLMMDRGYMSTENLKELKRAHHQFAMMCPDNLQLVKELISRHREVIKDNESYYIDSEDIYGVHLPGTVFRNSTYDAYVFYDEQRAHEERNSIHGRLGFFKQRLLEKKRYSAALSKKYEPWILVEQLSSKDESGRNFKISVKHENVQSLIDDAGYFVILSNAGLSAQKMIEIARMRDKNEKVFRRLKYHFGLTKTYTHKMETYEGKMFIAFVALIMVEAFRFYESKELHAKTSNTTATLLAELRKYQIRLKQNGKWMPQYAATSAQKKLLAALDQTAAQIEAAVGGLTLRV